MSWILASVVMVAIAMVVLSKRSPKRGPASIVFPYRKVGALFTPVERSFLDVLHQAVGSDAAIFGKVRAADIIEPQPGLSRGDRQKAFNKISGRHFDFLLCSSKNLSVLCAIELDHASHPTDSRVPGDQFLRAVCEAAGVPLILVPAKPGYIIDEVNRLIAPHLASQGRSHRKPSPARQKPRINGKLCPTCSATMVKRIAKKGSHAGMEFWACSTFPKCRTVEAVKPSSSGGLPASLAQSQF